MDKNWLEHIDTYHQQLQRLCVTNEKNRDLPPDQAFQQWVELTHEVRFRRRNVFLIGNGASASMASHFASDLAKNAHIHTEVLSDLALITAISNDMGYEHVFAEPLRRRGEPGDMLVAISSSGRSPNILAAVGVARNRQMSVITLSSMDVDNPLRAMGTLNFYIPADSYGNAETCHAAILHHWMDANVIQH